MLLCVFFVMLKVFSMLLIGLVKFIVSSMRLVLSVNLLFVILVILLFFYFRCMVVRFVMWLFLLMSVLVVID